MAENMEIDERKVQVKFVTKNDKYVVPDTAILVPTRLKRYGLSEIVNHMLNFEKTIPFTFLIDGETLRTSLEEYLESKGISAENVLILEYIESMLPPKSLSTFEHDDWVYCVSASNGYFLTGSYDNNARIWNKSGECLQTFTGHEGPIKSVAWLKSEGEYTFLTASQDHTVRAWRYDSNNMFETLYVAKGHKGSVESVSVDSTGKHFATASWDAEIKYYTSAVPDVDESEFLAGPENENNKKRKTKNSDNVLVKAPVTTLDAHVGPVSCVAFDPKDENILYSGGWDHSIRVWDIHKRTNLTTLSCEKTIYALAPSPLTGLLATGHADRVLRVWDPRSSDASMLKLSLPGHRNWVSSVAWSPSSEHHLVTGSYDGIVRVWDIRSRRAPIYTLLHGNDSEEEEQKVFCVEWSGDLLLSGGEDCRLRIHSAGMNQ
ncbi:uncharacterized protein VTP21DRAFT_7852 [Calcarisporiella thermophila]|uniref:uncharacterized protein n=1 Tax=Calcarisporiella thermophila TaxID=911321 RepID=UPI0037439347